LWAQGKADEVIQQERLLNEWAKTDNIDVHCGCVGSNGSKRDAEIVKKICAQHLAVAA
jgi:hypothetical protein